MRTSMHSKNRKIKEQKHSLQEYLQKKKRDLGSEETQQIKVQVERGQTNVYELADEFGCVPTQIAGIKAGLTKS